MRNRKQQGDRWYVRYWERRNIGGTIERKRVTHSIGEVTTRGKRPPADIKTEAERIATIGDFVEGVYIPWIEHYQRPSTLKGYRQVWKQHLRLAKGRTGEPSCESVWLKDTRTHHVQGWLNAIAKSGTLSRNSLKRIQSTLSGIFSLAKQLAYFEGG